MTRHSSLQAAAVGVVVVGVVVVVVVAVDLRVSSVWDPDMAFAPAPREGSRVAGLMDRMGRGGRRNAKRAAHPSLEDIGRCQDKKGLCKDADHG